MKRQLTTTAAAAAIAMSGMSATPASALTDEEAFLLFAGIAAFAIIAGGSGPAPAPIPVPAPPPVTHSTGPILLKQTYTVNMDNGTVASPGADLWFRAVNPTLRYLEPINGAKMAVGDRSNRGYDGCAAETFTHHRVNINLIPVGSYVCMKTNQGRISQFRVNAVYGGAVKKMKLGYTTWQ